MSLFQRLRIPGLTLQSLTTLFGVVTAFMLPLQTRMIILPGALGGQYWEYGTLALYVTDIPVLLFLLCGIMTISEKKAPQRRIPILALLAIVGASILAVDSARYPATSFIALWTLCVKGLGVAYICAHVPLRTTLIAWGCIASGILESAIACVQYAQQQVIAIPGLGMTQHLPQVYGTQVLQVGGERILRAYGTLPHPNMLGGFVMVALLCACTQAFTAHTSFERRLSSCAILFLSCGLWMSFSRQAFLGAAVGVAFLALRSILRTRIPLARVALVLATLLAPLVFLTALAPDVVATRLFIQEPLEERSVDERIEFIEDSHRLIRDHAWWGIGLEQTTSELYTDDHNNGRARDVSTYQPVHVVPLLVWQELGLFGLLAWLICLCVPFARNVGTTHSVFFAAYLGLLTISLWDHYLWSLPFGILLFWIVWGLTLNPRTTQQ